MRRGLSALCGLLAVVACSGAGSWAEEPLWARPDLGPNRSALADIHPLASVQQAFSRGDCGAVAALSAELRETIRGAIRDGFHAGVAPLPGPEPAADRAGAGAASAAEMRRLLDTYVYAEPPLLLIGRHRFVFPQWWSSEYGYCLAALGRYAEAADVYALMLQEELETDALWRLALVYAWAERVADAIELLRAWPRSLPAPSDLAAVLAHLEDGEPLAPPRPVARGE